MQTTQKNALRLMLALGAVSCGDSTQPGDSYQGFVDGTALEAKFQPGTCDKTKCYKPMAGSADGASFSFYNLGFVDKKLLKEDSAKRPVLPASLVKMGGYDFPEPCAAGKEYDARTDAYREDVQYPVFDALPLASAASSTVAVLPLVKVKDWTGVSRHTCNAIKDAKSLADGNFGGAAAEGEKVAVRAVIDMTVDFKAPTGSTFAPVSGWYRGLQLVYLDGGEVPVDAEGNVKVMEGVLVKPASGTAPKPNEPTATLVFQARPGEEAFSPVVRLREFTAAGGTTPSSYKSLCFDPPAEGCPAGSINMTQLTTFTGMLFLVSAQ